MRLIGTLPSETDATRFSDFVLTLGMQARVEPSSAGDAWQVWIEHDDHLEQAAAQLHAFRANPNDPKYDDASATARRLRRERDAEAEKRRRNFRDVRTKVFGNAGRHATPVTIVLIAICVLVALGTGFNMGEEATPLREALLFQPRAAIDRLVDTANADDGVQIGKGHATTMFSTVASGQVWRLVTPMLLHFSILHLMFNLFWLSDLGRMIESRRGPIYFAAFVMIAAVMSNLAQALWTVYGPFGIGYSAFGGMSGVVYALFGYAWIKGRYQSYEGIGIHPQTVGLMLGWLVLCMTGLVGNVANAAHVGGLAIGALVAAWPTLRRKIKAS